MHYIFCWFHIKSRDELKWSTVLCHSLLKIRSQNASSQTFLSRLGVGLFLFGKLTRSRDKAYSYFRGTQTNGCSPLMHMEVLIDLYIQTDTQESPGI